MDLTALAISKPKNKKKQSGVNLSWSVHLCWIYPKLNNLFINKIILIHKQLIKQALQHRKKNQLTLKYVLSPFQSVYLKPAAITAVWTRGPCHHVVRKNEHSASLSSAPFMQYCILWWSSYVPALPWWQQLLCSTKRLHIFRSQRISAVNRSRQCRCID